jgi:hypothetical protein
LTGGTRVVTTNEEKKFNPKTNYHITNEIYTLSSSPGLSTQMAYQGVELALISYMKKICKFFYFSFDKPPPQEMCEGIVDETIFIFIFNTILILLRM